MRKLSWIVVVPRSGRAKVAVLGWHTPVDTCSATRTTLSSVEAPWTIFQGSTAELFGYQVEDKLKQEALADAHEATDSASCKSVECVHEVMGLRCRPRHHNSSRDAQRRASSVP